MTLVKVPRNWPAHRGAAIRVTIPVGIPHILTQDADTEALLDSAAFLVQPWRRS